MRPVKWGIVSTAHINRLVIPPAQASEKCDLIAVASRDAARAEMYAREWGIERSYGSYEALLDDPDVEAVYISLPNSMHCEWSIRALEAGKHVLCEKPLSRRAADVEAAFDAADRSGRLLSEAFMWRHNPQTRSSTELVDAGAIGALRADPLVLQLLDRGRPGQRAPALGAGGRRADGRRLLLRQRGAAARRRAAADRGRPGARWRRSRRRLRRRDALPRRRRDWRISTAASSLPARDELEVIGEEGSLFLDDPWHGREPLIEIRRDGAVERIETERVDSYQLELENLSDAIRGEAEPLLGRADAVGNARALEALYASAEPS